MSITLKEIASLAKVSIATASYVLNDHPKSRSMNEETVLRVKKVAAAYGFVPSKAAGSLKQGRHDLIALIAPHVGDFFAGLSQGIESEGDKHRLQLMTASTFDSAEREREYVKRLLARRVDGMIVLPLDVSARHLDYLYRSRVPVIFFRRRAGSTAPAKFMTFDDIEVGRLAARHLIERGCRRIALLTHPEWIRREYYRIVHDALFEGCREACEEAGLPFGEDDVLGVDTDRPTYGDDLVRAVREGGYDGLFGLSDVTCAGALNALHRARIRVPEKVKVVSFGDGELARFSIPALTSVGLPKAELGREMVRALVRMVENRAQEADEVLLKPSLTVRESTG